MADGQRWPSGQQVGRELDRQARGQVLTERGVQKLIGLQARAVTDRLGSLNEEEPAHRNARRGQGCPEPGECLGAAAKQRGKVAVQLSFGDPLPVPVDHAERDQREPLQLLLDMVGYLASGRRHLGLGELACGKGSEQLLVKPCLVQRLAATGAGAAPQRVGVSIVQGQHQQQQRLARQRPVPRHNLCGQRLQAARPQVIFVVQVPDVNPSPDLFLAEGLQPQRDGALGVPGPVGHRDPAGDQRNHRSALARLRQRGSVTCVPQIERDRHRRALSR